MNNRYYKAHPSFLLPEKPDVILERYINLEKFEWLIKEERLYMANAGILGNSLEGVIPQNEERFLDNRYRQFIDNFRNFYFVSCWHMTRSNSKIIPSIATAPDPIV
jgi:hypothetical protein